MGLNPLSGAISTPHRQIRFRQEIADVSPVSTFARSPESPPDFPFRSGRSAMISRPPVANHDRTAENPRLKQLVDLRQRLRQPEPGLHLMGGFYTMQPPGYSNHFRCLQTFVKRL